MRLKFLTTKKHLNEHGIYIIVLIIVSLDPCLGDQINHKMLGKLT